MKMLSLKAHVYAGRRVKVGDVFTVRGKGDARLLAALGRAKEHVEIVPFVPPVMEPVVVMEPEAASPTEVESFAVGAEFTEIPEVVVPRKTKRTYRRRDMTAEGSE